jgi:hypothetical protein
VEVVLRGEAKAERESEQLTRNGSAKHDEASAQAGEEANTELHHGDECNIGERDALAVRADGECDHEHEHQLGPRGHAVVADDGRGGDEATCTRERGDEGSDFGVGDLHDASGSRGRRARIVAVDVRGE